MRLGGVVGHRQWRQAMALNLCEYTPRQFRSHFPWRVQISHIEIQAQHRSRAILPVPMPLVADPRIRKQVAAALKQGFDRGQQQGLAETARSGEKQMGAVPLSLREQVRDAVCLVHIQRYRALACVCMWAKSSLPNGSCGIMRSVSLLGSRGRRALWTNIGLRTVSPNPSSGQVRHPLSL